MVDLRQRRPSLEAALKGTTIICLLICLLPKTSSANLTTPEPLYLDSVLLTRCRALCYPQYENKTCKLDCAKDFIQNEDNGKLGDCPTPTNFAQQNCSLPCNGADYECPDTQKCCITRCGRACQLPLGLDRIQNLPPVPTNLKVITSDRIPHRKVFVEWELPAYLEHYGRILFVLQSRSHAGEEFSETKLNLFQPHNAVSFYEEKTSYRRTYTSTVKLSPQRWYEFRVATVNVYGTRGFTKNTKPFKLSKMPNPPEAPMNLKLDPFRLGANGTLTQKVSWHPPKSDIPVKRYRISWSLYINGTVLKNSLMKEMASVAEPKHHYVIRDLLPNSMYYLQIHAVSVFGFKRLKSEAATQMINTTLTSEIKRQLYNNPLMANKSQALSNVKSIVGRESNAANNREIVTIVPTENEDFRIKFMARRRFGLVVRADVRLAHERIRFEICNGTDTCLTNKLQKSQVFVTKRSHRDFKNLNFHSEYTIGFKLLANNATNKSDYDYKTTFVTPTCETYRKTYKKLDIQCPDVPGNGTNANIESLMHWMQLLKLKNNLENLE